MYRFIRNYLIILIALSIVCSGCAVPLQELRESDSQSLKEQWMKSSSFEKRLSIINEFERRKDVDATIACLGLASHHLYGRAKKDKDIISIIQALGYIGDPKAIDSIIKASERRSKKVTLVAISAFKKINSKEAVFPTISLMNTFDSDVRWEGLDALSQFKDPASIEAIYPLLFDEDPKIRWKAIHTIGDMGNKNSIGKVSMLLADEDKLVRESAANVLIKLGVSEQEVESWKNKAQNISIEEIYQSQLNYHRAVAEKEILNKKLENELITQGIALNHTKSLVGNEDPLSPNINNTAAKDTKQQDLGNIADITGTKSTPLKLNMSSPDGIAVIIGTNSYNHKDIPDVLYAKNDAEAMKKCLVETLGYKDGNIILQIDPAKADLEMIFGIKGNYKGMLYDYIKPNKSDVFIYYSGHGAPDVNTNKAYFVPKNGNPSKIAFTGYPLDTFYENISQLPAKKMTVVIDACFSGGTDSGKWIVSNASPALINISTSLVNKKMTVFTSSESSQISSWYPEQKHGLFTYFFLKAVNGEADKNSNRQITFNEIYNYVSDRTEGVPYWAKRLHGGRVQMPTLQAMNKDEVFISY
jgi:HEAT repeat protein